MLTQARPHSPNDVCLANGHGHCVRATALAQQCLSLPSVSVAAADDHPNGAPRLFYERSRNHRDAASSEAARRKISFGNANTSRTGPFAGRSLRVHSSVAIRYLRESQKGGGRLAYRGLSWISFGASRAYTLARSHTHRRSHHADRDAPSQYLSARGALHSRPVGARGPFT